MSEIEALKRRWADLRARLPRHSIPPAMLQELEDLEEERSRRRDPEGDKDADLRVHLPQLRPGV